MSRKIKNLREASRITFSYPTRRTRRYCRVAKIEKDAIVCQDLRHSMENGEKAIRRFKIAKIKNLVVTRS